MRNVPRNELDRIPTSQMQAKLLMDSDARASEVSAEKSIVCVSQVVSHVHLTVDVTIAVTHQRMDSSQVFTLHEVAVVTTVDVGRSTVFVFKTENFVVLVVNARIAKINQVMRKQVAVQLLR